MFSRQGVYDVTNAPSELHYYRTTERGSDEYIVILKSPKSINGHGKCNMITLHQFNKSYGLDS